MKRNLSFRLNNKYFGIITSFIFLFAANCFYDPGTDDQLESVSMVVALALGKSGLQTGDCTCATEGNTTTSYGLYLEDQPMEDVTVTITPDDQVIVNGSTTPVNITFTPLNYSENQTITVSAVDDSVAEGNHIGIITNIATGGYGDYIGKNLGTVEVTITDNDSAGVSIVESSGSTVSGEGTTADTYTIVLTSEPVGEVTVSINADSQLSVDKSSVVFTLTNWNVPQTISVTAIDDDIDEINTHNGMITHSVSSSDTEYNGLGVNNVIGVITDNDTAGVSINIGDGVAVTEGNPGDTYSIILNSRPTANVTINISSDSLQLSHSNSVVFTPAEWNVAKTITVTAVDDTIYEKPFTSSNAINHTSASFDTNYNGIPGIDMADVSFTDNDPDPVPPALSTGLYAWYPLDGNIYDQSGDRRHGSFPGGFWPVTTGPSYTENRFSQANEAASFNGTDQYFQSDYKPLCHEDFSVAFWFYSNIGTDNKFMGTQDPWPASNPGVTFGIGNDTKPMFYAFWISWGGNMDGISAVSPNAISVATWTHYAYVHNGTTHHGNIWINGVSVAATANFGGCGCTGVGSWQWWTGPMMIGYGYANVHYNGRMEDVWFFQGRQLSGADITTIMNTN